MATSTPSNDQSTDEPPVIDRSTAWRDLQVLLATGFRHPDDRLREAITSGEFEHELRSLASELGLDLEIELDVPIDAEADLTTAYIDLFEGGKRPYAPPAESPYRGWYGDRDGGLMSGPSAAEMRERYQALEASVPGEYTADHVALLLEYGSLIVEVNDREIYRSFVRTHYDWTPAFRRLADDAAADAPFHRWLVAVTDEVLAAVRDRLGFEEPTADEIDRMADRI
jgi:TorA maturation chaperone TorD